MNEQLVAYINSLYDQGRDENYILNSLMLNPTYKMEKGAAQQAITEVLKKKDDGITSSFQPSTRDLQVVIPSSQLPSEDFSSQPPIIEEPELEADGESATWFSPVEAVLDDIPLLGGAADFAGDMVRSFKGGRIEGQAGGELFESVFGDGITDDNLKAIVEAYEASTKAGMSDEAQKLEKELEKMRQEGASGLDLLAYRFSSTKGLQSSFEIMVNSLGRQFGGVFDDEGTNLKQAGKYGAGAGAAAAAIVGVAGQVGPQVALPEELATMPAAFVTVGGRTAIGVLGGLVEVEATIFEMLKEEIGDAEFNEENIKKVLSDEDVLARMRSKAKARGISIGAIDSIFMGAGSAVEKTLVKAGTSSTKRFGTGLVLEGVGGSLGEGVAQAVTDGELDWEEIGLEGLASAPGAVVTQVITKSPVYKIDGEKVTLQQLTDLLNSGEAIGNVEVENDSAVKGAVDKAKKSQKKSMSDVQSRLQDEAHKRGIHLSGLALKRAVGHAYKNIQDAIANNDQVAIDKAMDAAFDFVNRRYADDVSTVPIESMGSGERGRAMGSSTYDSKGSEAAGLKKRAAQIREEAKGKTDRKEKQKLLKIAESLEAQAKDITAERSEFFRLLTLANPELSAQIQRLDIEAYNIESQLRNQDLNDETRSNLETTLKEVVAARYELEQQAQGIDFDTLESNSVTADFSSQLERKLADVDERVEQLQAKVDELKKDSDTLFGDPDALADAEADLLNALEDKAEISDALAALEQAEAELEALSDQQGSRAEALKQEANKKVSDAKQTIADILGVEAINIDEVVEETTTEQPSDQTAVEGTEDTTTEETAKDEGVKTREQIVQETLAEEQARFESNIENLTEGIETEDITAENEIVGKVPDEFGGDDVEMRYTTKTPQGATKTPRAKDGAAAWREGMAGGKIDIKKAKVLNNLQKLLDKIGVEIYVYENFDAAQAYKEGNWGGLYKDGAVHINLDQIIENQKVESSSGFKRTKSFAETVQEEVQHAVVGKVFSKMFSENPSKAEKIKAKLLKSVSRDKALLERLESKEATYRENNVSEAVIFEEIMIEAMSAIAGGTEKVNLSVIDQVRVLYNEMIIALGLDKSLTIKNSDDFIALAVKFKAAQQGKDFNIDPLLADRADASKIADANERGSTLISPAKIPANKDGGVTVVVYKEAYRRTRDGDRKGIGAYPEERKFNDQWHFINWWRKAAKNNPDYGPFETTDGKTIDVDRINSYKVRQNTQLSAVDSDIRDINRMVAQAQNDGIITSSVAAKIKSKVRGITRRSENFSRQGLEDKKSAYQQPLSNSVSEFKDYVQDLISDNAEKLGKEFRYGKGDDVRSSVQLARYIQGIDKNSFLNYERVADQIEKLTGKRPNSRVQTYQYLFEEVMNRFDNQEDRKALYGSLLGNYIADPNISVEQFGENNPIDFFKDYQKEAVNTINRLVDSGEISGSKKDNLAKFNFFSALLSAKNTAMPNMQAAIALLKESEKEKVNHPLGISDSIISKVRKGKIDGVQGMTKSSVAVGLKKLKAVVDGDLNEIPGIPSTVKDRINQATGRQGSFVDKYGNINFTKLVEFLMTPYEGSRVKVEGDVVAQQIFGHKIGAWVLNMNAELMPDVVVDGKRLSDIVTVDTHVLNTGALVLGEFYDASLSAVQRISIFDRLRESYDAAHNSTINQKRYDEIERARIALQTDPSSRTNREKALIKRANDIISGNIKWAESTIQFLEMEGRDQEARTIERALEKMVNPAVSESKPLKRRISEYVKELTVQLNDSFDTNLTPAQVGQLIFADRQTFKFNMFNDDGSVNKGNNEYNTYAEALRVLASNGKAESVNEGMASMQLMPSFETNQKADESPLFRVRQNAEALLMKNGRMLNNREVDKALSTDATSRRIIAKNVDVKEGDKVGIRLNLNVMKNTGIPVQTVHEKSASGEALKYAPAIMVKNADLYVNQNARNKIVTFQENKFPMASVNGDFVSSNIEEMNYNGVKAFFNPFNHNVFVDAAGRPIKSASEATIVGNTVYLRGDIEYYSFDDPILEKGRMETPEQKSKRIKKGPKYNKGLKRFVMWSKKNGIEFANNLEAELAYDNMPINSIVALNESEVLNRMEEASERASNMLKLRGTAGRGARTYGRVRAEILSNPNNYFTPQKLNDIKNRLEGMSDQDLIAEMNGEGLGKLQERNDDLGVLAISELINRAIASGNDAAIPGLIEQASQIGTTVGRIMRHLRELKSSTPASIVKSIVAEVEKRGNRLSADQMTRLEDISGNLFRLQAEHADLVRRGIRGEDVDAQLQKVTTELKAVERQLDTFSNAVIERGWGQIGTMLIQGNLLTPMSQITNVGANMVNALGKVGVDIIALPVEKLINMFGIESPMKRNYSINAYMYGLRKFGAGFVEALDSIVTGQEKDVTEWRVHRGFAPFRSLMSAMGKGDLPLGPDGKVSLSQRIKLGVQGTLGIPAETMFRFLSLGDTPFRKYAEGIDLYRAGVAQGLEGEALQNFLKFPTKKALDAAQREGRKLTFQEQTTLSRTAENVVKMFEDVGARALGWIPGVDGQAFAKFMVRSNLPYLRTPANILMETLTYVSPYVAVPRIMKKLQEGDARSAAENFGKLAVGTMAAQFATVLIKEGLISGAIEWDEDEEKNIAYDQFPPNSINVSGLKRWLSGGTTAHQNDDYFIGYNKLGVIGAIIGAIEKSTDRDELRNRDYSETSFATHAIQDAFGVGAFSSMAYMMDQSFLQGMNNLISVVSSADVTDFERNFENWTRTTFQAVSATALPNTLSALYRGSREYMPDTRTTKDESLSDRILKRMNYTIKERTFGLSDVPVRVNWKGQPIKQTPRGTTGMMYNLFDITKARQGEDDPVSNEIYRLYEQTLDLPKVVGTPGYATKSKLSVPNPTRKHMTKLRSMGLDYDWMKDEEFMAERLYLSVEHINRLMAVSGKERYAEVESFMNSEKYQSMSDDEKVEALNEINDNYNSAIEYKKGVFKKHSLELFKIMQEIYESERTK